MQGASLVSCVTRCAHQYGDLEQTTAKALGVLIGPAAQTDTMGMSHPACVAKKKGGACNCVETALLRALSLYDRCRAVLESLDLLSHWDAA